MFRIIQCEIPINKHYVTCLYNSWRHAGHSKWQNIRHIKAEKDGQRSNIFARLSRLMLSAVREGKSADPLVNVRLAQMIEQAKKANMPVATLNGILKSLKGTNGNTNNEMQSIELSGPGGSALILGISTNNFTKVKSQIYTLQRKSKGAFSYGSILHLFDCKSIIQTDFPPGATLEDAVNLAIELEIEDVVQVNEADHTFLQFTGTALHLNKIKTQLESKNYFVQSAELNYEPLMQVVLKDDDLESVNWLFAKLQEISEVVNIFDNIAWPEGS